jgi:DNA-binding NtrC family response regulator
MPLGQTGLHSKNYPFVEEVAASEEAPTVEVRVPSTGTEVILLVDDDPAVRRIARQMLRVLGYRTVEAAGAEEAVRIAAGFRGRIHLLLTDVVMPGPNGRALTSVLTARHPDLKVLLMSGHRLDPAVHRRVEDRSVHFLSKPFSIVELADKVRTAIDRK